MPAATTLSLDLNRRHTIYAAMKATIEQKTAMIEACNLPAVHRFAVEEIVEAAKVIIDLYPGDHHVRYEVDSLLHQSPALAPFWYELGVARLPAANSLAPSCA